MCVANSGSKNIVKTNAFTTGLRVAVQQKQADLLRPLIEKARAAVEKIATSQGFDYVIDSSQGSSVLMAKGKDLMADVKTELGF